MNGQGFGVANRISRSCHWGRESDTSNIALCYPVDAYWFKQRLVTLLTKGGEFINVTKKREVLTHYQGSWS
jgi:hypothetical protein